jgi:hypothetical protein
VFIQAEKDASGKSKFDRLHQVAVGLSRSELDDESMESVVNNLDKLGVIPWDKTQVHCQARQGEGVGGWEGFSIHNNSLI